MSAATTHKLATRPRVFQRFAGVSLSTRIFAAMLIGAMTVHIVAGFAVLTRISDDFDQRLTLQSTNAKLLATQFYDQQEKQLAATAQLVANMGTVRAALADNDVNALLKTKVDLEQTADGAANPVGFLVYRADGSVLANGVTVAINDSRPASVDVVLNGSAQVGQGVETFADRPSLVGSAPIVIDGLVKGAIALVRPIDGHMLAATEAEVGMPCAIYDATGHLLSTSQPNFVIPSINTFAFGPIATPAANNASNTGQHVTMAGQSVDAYFFNLLTIQGNIAGTMALFQPTGTVRQAQLNVEFLVVALVVAGFLVSATISLLFTRVIMRPIRQLARATDDIANGLYDRPIGVRGTDEIGQLTRSFERMRQRVRETTQQLVAEQVRSQNEATVVNAVLNATNDGIIMIDERGRYRTANQRWQTLFGIDAASIKDLPDFDLCRRVSQCMVDPASFEASTFALQADGERVLLAEEFEQQTPEVRRLRRFSAPVRQHDGKVIGRVFVYQDITLEHQADELKQALLSTVSHELRTPLTTIKGYARTLLLQDWSSDVQHDFLSVIDEEADKLSELVDNLLDLSKIESGALQLDRRPVVLMPVMSKVAQRWNGRATPSRLIVNCAESIPPVEGDSRRIEQIIGNLVENAHKYAEHGSITLSAFERGTDVLVSVADEGNGIPRDLRDRVFERFFQVDHSSTRPTGGSGLGLSICKGLVESHGGHIWIEDNRPSGTIVSFTLPVAVALSAAAAQSAG